MPNMRYTIFAFSLLFLGCKNQPSEKTTTVVASADQKVVTKYYELHKAASDKALLILFPGGGSTSKQTKEEFDIVDKALSSGISVLMMNFNRHLWINQDAIDHLVEVLTSAVGENKIQSENIFIGGMSIGGNVSLTLSDYLVKSNAKIKPKGIFIIDSPIDLYALYQNSKKDLTNPDFSEQRLAEPRWIVNYFEELFGKQSLLDSIQNVSPFTQVSKHINVPNLKDSKVRFYTEPDPDWWMENRQSEYENTNAYMIQNISKQLTESNWSNFELIQTKNKGYRANGDRHPHSWSIVDMDNLIDWISNNKKLK